MREIPAKVWRKWRNLRTKERKEWQQEVLILGQIEIEIENPRDCLLILGWELGFGYLQVEIHNVHVLCCGVIMVGFFLF